MLGQTLGLNRRAAEPRRQQRALPIGIIAALITCATLYVAVDLVLTCIADYETLDNAVPVANAAKAPGMYRSLLAIDIGAGASPASKEAASHCIKTTELKNHHGPQHSRRLLTSN